MIFQEQQVKAMSPIYILLLLIIIPFATPLSFNFTSFTTTTTDNNDGIIYHGSAQLINNSILLTTNVGPTIGHVTYSQPLHLYNTSSRNLTDFTTNFSFIVNSSGSTNYGDGFAFFLVPNGSTLAQNLTGFNLGLSDTPLNAEINHFVAVEFDILSTNGVDPPNEHVGIDINTIRSVANVTWWTADSIVEGREQEAWISYDSRSTNLNVVFTGFRNRVPITQSLSYVVDFRDYLPEYVSFGFSASTGGSAAFQSINSWSFSSSFTPGVESGNRNAAKPINWPMIGGVVGGVLAVVVVFVVGFILFISWKKRNRTTNEVEMAVREAAIDRLGSKEFAYKDLKKATNNFTNKLGRGGFGGVYKGFLREDNLHIAVKRVSEGSNQGIKEYVSELKIATTTRHINLVRILGWCHKNKTPVLGQRSSEEKTLLIVYEFVPNGSLESHLFKEVCSMNWGIRLQIVKGLAAALHYLHAGGSQYVVHRDIKPDNIMLDDNFVAKLGDFGLCRMVDHEKECKTTVANGTFGYRAPEYVNSRKPSKKADVFSFGVVALQIATGKHIMVGNGDEAEPMVDWVWDLFENDKLLDAVYPVLRNGTDFNSRESQEMARLLTVGLWCAHPDSKIRPHIEDVELVLNFRSDLPDLKSIVPSGSAYCAVSADPSSSSGVTTGLEDD